MAEKLHHKLEDDEFSLDDVVFPPRRIPDFEIGQVDLSKALTKHITLKTPLVSSPMDTVTEHRMAILIALHGGIGVIHYNFPTIDEQMREVEKVRRFEAAFVRNPIVLGTNATVGEILQAAEKNGFFSYPITEDGTLATRLVGFVSRRDVRYRENMNMTAEEIMTPRERLVVASREETLDIGDVRAANRIIRERNLDTLPIIDAEGKLAAIVTDSDLSKDRRYPLATKDANKQLKVLVAVESRLSAARDRIAAAAEKGASGIVVDARNIFKDHLDIAKWTKENYPDLDVIIGNAVTSEVVEDALAIAGQHIDAFRVGIGTGEVCVTTESLGIGRPLGSALRDIDRVLHAFPTKSQYGEIGMIADGGIKTPHHIVGALMLGAVSMMGSELAGLEESPFEAEYDSSRKRLVKRTRGMGSTEVIRQRAGANRYMIPASSIRFPEGIEKVISYKGSGEQNIQLLIAGIRQTLHGLGHKTTNELYRYGYMVPNKRAMSKGTL